MSFNINTTDSGLYLCLARFNNSSSCANFKAPSLHERAGVILMQPETILTLFLCFAAFLANLFSACATAHIPYGLTTHLKLILSLALSDMLTTLTVLTHILNKVFISPALPPFYSPKERLTSSCMMAFVNALNTSAHLISLLNLFAMAIDHYVAIIKPLHYPRLMNRARGNIMIVCLWLLAFLGGFFNFFTGVATFSSEVSERFNYCEFIMYNDFHGEYLVIATTLISLIAIVYIYIRIIFIVKNTKFRSGYINKDCLHNKKAIVTTLIIIGTFVLCWLPTCLFQIAMIIQIHLDEAVVKKLFAILLRANKYLYVLLLFNSLCDPVIYAIRLKCVQIGYYRLLARCIKVYKSKLQREGYSRQTSFSHV